MDSLEDVFRGSIIIPPARAEEDPPWLTATETRAEKTEACECHHSPCHDVAWQPNPQVRWPRRCHVPPGPIQSIPRTLQRQPHEPVSPGTPQHQVVKQSDAASAANLQFLTKARSLRAELERLRTDVPPCVQPPTPKHWPAGTLRITGDESPQGRAQPQPQPQPTTVADAAVLSAAQRKREWLEAEASAAIFAARADRARTMLQA